MFEKYNKIKSLDDEENAELLTDENDEIIIEEKLDGANFRIYLKKDGTVIFGSRSKELEENSENERWSTCINYLREKIRKAPKPNKNIIIYGECMLKHTIDYDWEKTPIFLAFDVKLLDGKKNNYLDYNSKTSYFKTFNLTPVPLLYKGKVRNMPEVTEESIPLSKYSSVSKAEGVVIKNYSKQLFGKFVRTEFKEKNSDAFGTSPKHCTSEEERFVAKYCTNARIEKNVLKLIDDGNKLELQLMNQLPNKVWYDIWEEEMKNILTFCKSLHFKKARKLITHRCLNVLKQMVVNNKRM